ncbi:hypothetical protein BKA64DRAFT_711629 [Cadophora sp. MPI-SDFR-AT-0126]|nr:hypothetical protein BKA64DRAFT_711629 [Leotiomycetes sp. MPI-SDFR-AT-0126]
MATSTSRSNMSSRDILYRISKPVTRKYLEKSNEKQQGDGRIFIDLTKDEEEEDEGFSEMEESLFLSRENTPDGGIFGTRESTPQEESLFLRRVSAPDDENHSSDLVGIGEDEEEEESLFLTREPIPEPDSELPSTPIALSINPLIPQSSIILALPLEIHLQILDALQNIHHTINLSPGTQHIHPLIALSRSNRSLYHTFHFWLRSQKRRHTEFIRHPRLGLFVPRLTAFSIAEDMQEQMLQRIYGPEQASRHMAALELWQEGMDRTGSIHHACINLVVRPNSPRRLRAFNHGVESGVFDLPVVEVGRVRDDAEWEERVKGNTRRRLLDNYIDFAQGADLLYSLQTPSSYQDPTAVMGKRSQRKKQLRAQYKCRERKKTEVHPASIPVKARRNKPELPTLLTIPLEIRFKIFTAIASGTHTITIAPNLHIYSPLTGLTYTHPQLEEEIAEWRKCYTRPAIHPVFSDFDPAHTTFRITFRSNERRITRIYDPTEAKTKMLNLELWKRAMDLVGTNKQFEVNMAIRYLTRRLWEWKPAMGRHKKHTVEFRRMQEKLRFLVFDEERHGNVSAITSPRMYEEPFGEKPMPDVKPALQVRHVNDSSNELTSYYRSLGIQVNNLELKHLERVGDPPALEEHLVVLDDLKFKDGQELSRVDSRPLATDICPYCRGHICANKFSILRTLFSPTMLVS